MLFCREKNYKYFRNDLYFYKMFRVMQWPKRKVTDLKKVLYIIGEVVEGEGWGAKQKQGLLPQSKILIVWVSPLLFLKN
jgi:hypothetical protein